MTLPAVPEMFYWTPSPWGSVLKCRPLAAIADHAFTTRNCSCHRRPWRRLADLPALRRS